MTTVALRRPHFAALLTLLGSALCTHGTRCEQRTVCRMHMESRPCERCLHGPRTLPAALFERLRLRNLVAVAGDAEALGGHCCSGTGVNCDACASALRRRRDAAGAAIALPFGALRPLPDFSAGPAFDAARAGDPEGTAALEALGCAIRLMSAGLGASHTPHLCAVPYARASTMVICN